MEVIGAEAECGEHVERHDHRRGESDQPGAAQHVAIDRGEILGRRYWMDRQLRTMSAQHGCQSGLFSRSGQQDDRIEHRFLNSAMFAPESLCRNGR
jgi:hypothetical protein